MRRGFTPRSSGLDLERCDVPRGRALRFSVVKVGKLRGNLT